MAERLSDVQTRLQALHELQEALGLDDAPLRLKRRKLEVSQNRLLDSDPWHVTSTVFSAFSKSDV